METMSALIPILPLLSTLPTSLSLQKAQESLEKKHFYNIFEIRQNIFLSHSAIRWVFPGHLIYSCMATLHCFWTSNYQKLVAVLYPSTKCLHCLLFLLIVTTDTCFLGEKKNHFLSHHEDALWDHDIDLDDALFLKTQFQSLTEQTGAIDTLKSEQPQHQTCQTPVR